MRGVAIASIKKVLVVGFFSPDQNVYTYASSFYRTFGQLGYVVSGFNIRKIVMPFYSRSNPNLLPYHIKRINDILLNRLLVQHVQRFRPDMVFFIKPDNITLSTMRTLKACNTRLACFYPDNPFSLWNGNANAQVLNGLPLYDYFLIWSKMLIPSLTSAGAKRVFYFPLAFDQELFEQPITISLIEKEFYTSDISFVGTWDPEREAWLTELVKNFPQKRIALWGNNWQHAVSANQYIKTIWQGPARYGAELIKIFRCSKIVLNFLRQQNMTAHNMRTFEAPAAGAFMLTQYSVEQAEQLFCEGESIVCFTSVQDLVTKVRFYLDHTKEREEIALRAHRVVQSFGLKKQLEMIMSLFEQESSEKGLCYDGCV
ncbi:MAG: glycosyltransferase [Epsilonproteobacteria bacterium]|nr:glycosyltransferase [Campylobacterota bacterium]